MKPAMYLGVGLAGGVGALLRFVVDTVVSDRLSTAFPAGTFVVNVSGAFALGLLSGTLLPLQAMQVIGVGAIGGYTTYSTWAFETHRLAEGGRLRLAVANGIAGMAVGLAAAALGGLVAHG